MNKHTGLLHKITYEGVSKSSELAHQVNAAVPVVSEMVQDHTKLNFAGPVVFRLVSPRHLIRANKIWMDEELSLLTDHQDDIDIPLNVLRKVAPLFIGGCMRLVWRGLGGQTIRRASGASEVLMVPRALRHLGSKDHHVTAIVAHELVHALQQDAVVNRSAYSVASFKGGANCARRYLAEGHATWATDLTTAELFGEPVTKISDNPSLTVRMQTRLLKKFIPALVDRTPYTDGAKFVRAIVDAGGTDLINQSWTGATTPTRDEIYDPQAWITRIKEQK